MKWSTETSASIGSLPNKKQWLPDFPGYLSDNSSRLGFLQRQPLCCLMPGENEVRQEEHVQNHASSLCVDSAKGTTQKVI